MIRRFHGSRPDAIGIFRMLVLVLLCSCSREPDTMAGGWIDTDTGRKVAGLVRREDGTGAAGALILLRPIDFLSKDTTVADSSGASVPSGTVLNDTCDSTGHFYLDSIAMGKYVLEAREREVKAVTVQFKIDRDHGQWTLQTATVKQVGTITGRIRFQDGLPGRVLVRIYGLERKAVTDSSGAYFFGNVPYGRYALHFTGLEPFIIPGDKADIPVSEGGVTDAGETLLQRAQRQSFRISGGSVELGIDSTNPIILENSAFQNPVDGAYLWAKSSLGHAHLVGTIVSFGADTGTVAVQANISNCERLIHLANYSGITGIPHAIAGARRPLTLSPGGSLDDIRPDTSEGALLLIREARNATPDKPLVLISGASLTTAAQALLLDPSIADRIVVFGSNNDNYNNQDSLSLAVMAHKARFVVWARNYAWPAAGIDWKIPDAFLTNRLGDALRSQYALDTTRGSWGKSFYGGFGAAAALFQPKLWSNAIASDYVAPPLQSKPSTRANYDFVDIPEAGNDWKAINEEFMSTLNGNAAYHPWVYSGALEAEAYQNSHNIMLGSNAQENSEVITFQGPGAWADYWIQIDATGNYTLGFRYQSSARTDVRVSDAETGAVTVVSLPGGANWSDAKGEYYFAAGVHHLHVESVQGGLVLNSVRFISH
ncbi:MAG: hypothetical protein JWO30_4167 [Fibrobacteres bacterium]|nr:hypothetical protein [Fibrobacterota bacterium]